MISIRILQLAKSEKIEYITRTGEHMIYDKIEKINKYKNISDNLKKAIEYIENIDLNDLDEKEFKIDGDEIYGSIKNFVLKDKESLYFENHNKYIDIQICLEYGEIIDHADKSEIINKIPYNADKDVEFGITNRFNNLFLSKGMFVIFFPNDAHKPCVKFEDYDKSCKLIVKVKNTI